MRFKLILICLIALASQLAWADQVRNYVVGPWKYTEYVESWPNYYSGVATYNHASEQSAINAGLEYLNAFPRACVAFTNNSPSDWGDFLYGDSSYGVHVEIGAKYYPRAIGGSLYDNGSFTRCDTPWEHAFLIARSRDLTCPAGYYQANGYCWAPDNIPMPDKNDCPKCDAAYLNQSNPIHGGLGYKAQTENDYSSTSSALSFNRFYISSNNRAASLLGNNWRHTYDRSLSYVDNFTHSLTTAVLNRPDSGRQYFKLVNNVWVPDAGFTERLEHLAGGGWLYTDNADTKERYSEEGQLLTIEDRNGRILTMQYTLDQLDALVDDEGRTLTFGYQYFASIPAGSSNTERKNRLTTVGLPDGNIIKYQYDANGMLERAIYPDATPLDSADNPYRRYQYGDGTNAPTHALTGLFDERGIQYASWQYDGAGRAISSEHGAPGSGIDKVSFVFNTDGSSVVTNPFNQARTYNFSVVNGVKKITTMSAPCPGCGVNFAARTYDTNGKVDIETDFAGTTTDTDYNSRGLLTQTIESANKAATKRTSQTDWHSTFNVPTERRVLNASNVLEAKTKYAYNARGQATSVCQIDPTNATAMAYVCGSAANAPVGVRQSSTAYCEQGDVTAGTCPLVGLVISNNGPRLNTDVSDVSTFSYYQNDHVDCVASPTTCAYRKGDVWKVTNALNHTIEYLSYDGAGRVLKMKDANNVVTDMEYNARGWLTARKVRGLDDTGEFYDDAITRLSYDEAGQVSRITGADGHLMGDYINFTYDAAHRLTGISDPLGNSITYTLDNTGNRIAEVTKDPEGAVTRSLASLYDTLGRFQTSKNAADIAVTSLTYDVNDNLDTSTDGLSRITDQDVDPLNRLIKTIQDVGGIGAATQLQYDARDNLTAVIDPNNLSTTYTYDGLNDLTKLSSPDTGSGTKSTLYTYDAAGNRKTQKDAKLVDTNYSYDGLNRLTQVSYPSASGLTSIFTYDTVNAICGSTENFSKGRLTRLTDASGETQYCYDRFGHMTRKQVTNNNVATTIAFLYTRGGRLSSITYPSGMKVGYVRDKANQVIQVNVTQGTTTKIFANNITYSPFGPLGRIEFPAPGSSGSNPLSTSPDLEASSATGNDVNASFVPGTDPEVSLVIEPDPCPGGCTPVNPIVQTRTYDQDYAIQSIGGLNYGVDLQGNITSITDSYGGNNFEYDRMDRLTKIKNSVTEADVLAFTYDATGNRLSKKNGTSAAVNNGYETGSHRLISVGSTTRTLDDNGNTTVAASNKRFTYDARNRMVEFKTSSSTVNRQYQYNARGERVRKYKNGIDFARYLFNESGQLLVQESIFMGVAMTQEIIWLDDMPVGVNQDGALHGIMTDHLNAPRAVFEIATQKTVWRWNMIDDAFGENPVIDDPDANGVAFKFDLRFPGQLFDSESELHYNYFRDYEAATGRYVESDPIGLKGGMNTFSYVEGNPIKYTDRAGLFCVPYWSESSEWSGIGAKRYGKKVVQPHSFGNVGTCSWKWLFVQKQKRTVVPRELCFDCEKKCGGEECSWKLRRGKPKLEIRENEGQKLGGNTIQINTGPPGQEIGCCKDPWNGVLSCGPINQ